MAIIKINATQALTGTLPAISGANLTGIAAGITEVDTWRVTGNNTNNGTDADITGWERADNPSATYIGTGMTESSGIFTFPSTGKYLIEARMVIYDDRSHAVCILDLETPMLTLSDFQRNNLLFL